MKQLLLLCLIAALYGCAGVPMESVENDALAKQFNAPSGESAGLYIYRSSFMGKALKKDIWVDGKCVGQSANDVFFYYEVPEGEHIIATESEFSPNELKLSAEKGALYFIRQYIKMGVFVGGANFEMVDPETAKAKITELGLAVGGNCSK